MNAQTSPAAAAALHIDYADPSQLPALLADPQVLAVFGFQTGDAAAPSDDPRYLQVGLQADGVAKLEVWRSDKPVSHGRDANGVAWASDGGSAPGYSGSANAPRRARTRRRAISQLSESSPVAPSPVAWWAVARGSAARSSVARSSEARPSRPPIVPSPATVSSIPEFAPLIGTGGVV